MLFAVLNQASKLKRSENDVRNFRKEALFWLFDVEEENLNSETMNNTDDSVSEFKKKNRHFQVWIPSEFMTRLEAELKTFGGENQKE
jgi:hypothetical protein